ncbi:MAG TPA: IS3 family transposase [Gaiellaceae bacterium]|nr:IS3 family transposase [Gaiellaceae bacterium]
MLWKTAPVAATRVPRRGVVEGVGAPKRRFEAISVMAGEGLPVEVACRVLDVSCAGFYAWRFRPPSARAVRHAWLTDVIREVHAASCGSYGAKRVHAELVLGRGIQVGHNAVEMLMRRAGIAGRTGARKRSLPGAPTADDLVDRMFVRDRPNRLWVTDITEHPTREGKVYCAVVLDAFSRRVVGWSISHNPTAALTCNALGMAIDQREAARGATVIHSDSDAIHIVGVHRSRPQIRSGPVDGLDRRLLRRDDRILLVADAGRAARHAPLEDPGRARERDLRVRRDLPQPAPTPLEPRHANTDRI